jgi:hypothetical protein
MHQLVIDLDIGSHEGGLSMCKRLIFVCIRSNRKDRHSPCVDRRGLHSLNSHNVFNSLGEMLKPPSQRERPSIVGAIANAPTDA